MGSQARVLRLSILLASLVGAPGWVGAQQPGPAVAPPAKLGMCTTCHGQFGVGVIPDAPHIAGQVQMYLVAQMRAFRSGARRHEVMNVIAKPLTDEEIAELSAWYSAVRVEVVPR